MRFPWWDRDIRPEGKVVLCDDGYMPVWLRWRVISNDQWEPEPWTQMELLGIEMWKAGKKYRENILKTNAMYERLTK